jgi:hypothetical protein
MKKLLIIFGSIGKAIKFSVATDKRFNTTKILFNIHGNVMILINIKDEKIL